MILCFFGTQNLASGVKSAHTTQCNSTELNKSYTLVLLVSVFTVEAKPHALTSIFKIHRRVVVAVLEIPIKSQSSFVLALVSLNCKTPSPNTSNWEVFEFLAFNRQCNERLDPKNFDFLSLLWRLPGYSRRQVGRKEGEAEVKSFFHPIVQLYNQSTSRLTCKDSWTD